MMSPEPADDAKAVVVFDVCDTLYATNTTVGFLRHRKTKSAERALARWTSRRSPYFYLGAASARLVGFDLARQRLVAALRGETREFLERTAQDYVQRVLEPLANGEVHRRLRNHQSAGHRIVLMSNSLDLVIKPIADLLDAEFRASTLGFDGDRCTGTITADLTGRKSEALIDLRRGADGPLWVYTDNRSDRDLLALADNKVIVLPRSGTQSEWGESGSDYIRL